MVVGLVGDQVDGAKLSYSGTVAFTTVVTAEATALSDQESALTSRAQRMTAAVSLVVALGGGWSAADLPPLTALATPTLNPALPTPTP